VSFLLFLAYDMNLNPSSMKNLFTVLACFVSAIALAQDNEVIRRADSLMSNQQYQKALAILEKSDSSSLPVVMRMAQCSNAIGASRAAIKLYEKALLIDSDNVTALSHLAQLYVRDFNPKMAMICYYSLIRLDSTNGFYYKQAGNVSLMIEDEPGARVWYQTALELNAADQEAALGLAVLLLEDEHFAETDSVITRALRFDPASRPLRLLKARSAYAQHNYDLAISVINNILENSDTTQMYARLLGTSYFQAKQYSAAVPCMNFLLRAGQQDDRIFYYLGVEARERGDINSSVTYFRKAAELSMSENTSIYFSHLGQSYEDLKDYPKAIKAYRDAYNHSGKGILLYHLARNYDTYYRDKDVAFKYYEKYLESADTVRKAKEYARKRLQDMGKF
jgi:tetratricopeptide (TPR) repeat protein